MAKITYVDGDVLDHLFSENCKVTTERIDNRHWLVQIYEPDGSVVSLDFFTFDKPIVSTERDAELHVHPTEAGGESCLCEKPLDDDGWRCIRCGKLLAPRLGG